MGNITVNLPEENHVKAPVSMHQGKAGDKIDYLYNELTNAQNLLTELESSYDSLFETMLTNAQARISALQTKIDAITNNELVNDEALQEIVTELQDIVNNLLTIGDNSTEALENNYAALLSKNATYSVVIGDNTVQYDEFARINYPMEVTTNEVTIKRFPKPEGGFNPATDAVPDNAEQSTVEVTETNNKTFVILKQKSGQNGGPSYLGISNDFEINEDEEPGVTLHDYYLIGENPFVFNDEAAETQLTIQKI